MNTQAATTPPPTASSWLAGFLVAWIGPAPVFALNAISFLGIAAATLAWRQERPARPYEAEGFGEALTAGLRYLRSAPGVRRVILRAGRHVETFIVTSWAEHLRRHDGRWTGSARDTRARVHDLVIGDPEIHHLFPAGTPESGVRP